MLQFSRHATKRLLGFSGHRMLHLGANKEKLGVSKILSVYGLSPHFALVKHLYTLPAAINILQSLIAEHPDDSNVPLAAWIVSQRYFADKSRLPDEFMYRKFSGNGDAECSRRSQFIREATAVCSDGFAELDKGESSRNIGTGPSSLCAYSLGKRLSAQDWLIDPANPAAILAGRSRETGLIALGENTTPNGNRLDQNRKSSSKKFTVEPVMVFDNKKDPLILHEEHTQQIYGSVCEAFDASALQMMIASGHDGRTWEEMLDQIVDLICRNGVTENAAIRLRKENLEVIQKVNAITAVAEQLGIKPGITPNTINRQSETTFRLP